MQENVALARHTTIGTGGPARFFARPETVDELVEALPTVNGREAGMNTAPGKSFSK